MQGSFFVISVFLQTVRGYSAIQTGLILTPATIGILLTSSRRGQACQAAPPADAHRGRVYVATIAGTAAADSTWQRHIQHPRSSFLAYS